MPFPRLVQFLFAALGFAVGFAVAAAVLGIAVGPMQVPQVTPRLTWLAAHPKDFDTLVFGSSHMRQVVPAVLEARLAAAGRPVKIFNCAADGARPPEDGYILDRALETQAAPLKFILVEANPIALRMTEDEEEIPRTIHWHDTRSMLAIWRAAFSHSLREPPGFGKWISDTWRNARFAARHTRLWVTNSARSGRGSELLYDKLHLELLPTLKMGVGARNDGYIPPSRKTPMTAKETSGYLIALKKKLRFGRDLDPMDAASQHEIVRAERLARQFGARLVVVAPPVTTVKTFQPLFPPGSKALFIDLTNPVEYPELFEPKVRIDGGHMTAEGSILFTEVLGRRLVKELDLAGG
jgi:hypothetical protein